jgi:nitrous oxidase accessory protein
MKRKKMAYLTVLMFLILTSLTFPRFVQSESRDQNLQLLLADAKPNSIVYIPPGIYKGAFTINKPLKIMPLQKGTVLLLQTNDSPVLHIKSNNVSISDLQITAKTGRNSPALLVEGDHVNLDRLYVQTVGMGIAFRNANHGAVFDTVIEWGGSPTLPVMERRNGIDLYHSHDILLIANRIQGMFDAIYLENSDQTVVRENQIKSSRYGVHCMYTNGTVIENNYGIANITGAMVMAVQNVKITNNLFERQSENVNSQGILLFDAKDTVVVNNKIEGNRVGFYIEQSFNNHFENNDVLFNFIGIQMLESQENLFRGNQFIGNVVNASSRESENNEIYGNYWDDFQGIDFDGDGKSDTQYAINPFFQGLIEKRPAFQLLFQSPSISFLEDLYQSNRSKWTTDRSALMEPKPVTYVKGRSIDQSFGAVGFLSIIFLTFSCLTVYYSRRKLV